MNKGCFPVRMCNSRLLLLFILAHCQGLLNIQEGNDGIIDVMSSTRSFLAVTRQSDCCEKRTVAEVMATSLKRSQMWKQISNKEKKKRFILEPVLLSNDGLIIAIFRAPTFCFAFNVVYDLAKLPNCFQPVQRLKFLSSLCLAKPVTQTAIICVGL